MAKLKELEPTTMTEKKIPDAETRRRNIERLRESNRQLELWGIQLEELIPF